MFCTNCGATVSGAFCPACGTRQTPESPAPGYASQPSYIPAAAALPALPYATWASRVGAYLIDMLLVVAVMIILGVFAGLLGLTAASLEGMMRSRGDLGGSTCCCMLALFPVAQLLVGIYNRIILVARRGYSIGQGVVRIKTVDAYGNLLPVGTLLLRLVVQVALSFIFVIGILDLLWPLWDERRQTLHDKAVGSYVIDNPDRVAPVF